MTNLTKSYCPLSEDFFYWPPEEIAQYINWCEVGNCQHKKRLKKVNKVKKPPTSTLFK
jgi:hypothetical protein